MIIKKRQNIKKNLTSICLRFDYFFKKLRLKIKINVNEYKNKFNVNEDTNKNSNLPSYKSDFLFSLSIILLILSSNFSPILSDFFKFLLDD